MKKIISFVLVICILSGLCLAYAIDAGSARVVIGANLSEDEIKSVYSTFGVTRGAVTELTVTNSEERDYLEGLVDDSVIGTRSISCVYIEILSQGSGLEVSTSNINWCTREMYLSALTTAGIVDAKVIVAAPWEVSGTAALTGIYKAYEDLTGQKLDELAKIAGTQELVITAELADEISSYDAVAIVNELKLILAETKNMTDAEVLAEIDNIAEEYSVSLNDAEKNKLLSLCRSMEGLSDEELQAKVESIQSTIKTASAVKNGAAKVFDTVKVVVTTVADKVVGAFTSFFDAIFK